MAKRHPVLGCCFSFMAFGDQEIAQQVVREARQPLALDVRGVMVGEPRIEDRFPDLSLQFMGAGQGVGGQPAIVVVVAAKQDPPEFRHDLGTVPKFGFRSAQIAESRVGSVGVSRLCCDTGSSAEENRRFPV